MDWWRFDRYVIRDGYVRPAARAKLHRYDPWKAFWQFRNDARGLRQPTRRVQLGAPLSPSDWEHPPYKTLSELIQRVRSESSEPAEAVERSPELQRTITTWCAKYGLLGIFPHRASSVTFSPQLELRPMPNSLRRKDSKPRRRRFHVQTSHLRTSVGWQSKWVVGTKSSSESWKSPGVDIQLRLDEPHRERRPLEPALTQYFPSVTTKKATPKVYPMPSEAAFWRRYAEPLPQFLDGAGNLLDAMELIGSEHSRDVGLRTLNALMSPAGVAIVPSVDGNFRQQWFGPSLLATLALMLAQDLNNGGQVRQCVACQHVFVTRAHQANSCSKQCRKLAQKRRGRAKARQVKRPGANVR